MGGIVAYSEASGEGDLKQAPKGENAKGRGMDDKKNEKRGETAAMQDPEGDGAGKEEMVVEL